MSDDEQIQEDQTRFTPGRPIARPLAASAVLTVLFALFAVGGVFFGYVFATTVADLLVAGSPQSPLASQPFAPKPNPTPGSTTAPGGKPDGAAPTPDPWAGVTPWQSSDRVTILLLGLDTRDDERNLPTRSDTMILLTVDPVHKRAGMLTIPRDLWVPIPRFGSFPGGENKINTAHFYGERERPGGGPELAKRTVELNFGVRVNYYARVDFHGFEQLIDAVDGITVDVERPIRDDEYPLGSSSDEGGIRRIYFPTGLQHLSGAEALRYARSRHADNDFGRNHRQQQVLLAARSRVLQPSILPKIPQMIGILRGALQTDVPLTDVLPLLNLARSIQAGDIVARSIEYSMTLDVNGDGTVLVPARDKIRPVIEEVFSDSPRTPTPTPAPTRAPTATPTEVANGAPVAVRVLNGTLRDRLAANTAEKLRDRGYEITGVGQASRSDYAETLILDHTGRPGAAAGLARLLGLPADVVQRAQPAEDGSDVTVILGLDAPDP